MIIINVKEGGLDRSLKMFKRKFDKVKLLKEIRRRQFFEKKSVSRRNEVKQAQFRNKFKSQDIF